MASLQQVVNQSKYKLLMFVENNELRNKYSGQILQHNLSVESNMHADSGFDIFTPERYEIHNTIQKVDFGVKCCMLSLTTKRQATNLLHFTYILVRAFQKQGFVLQTV